MGLFVLKLILWALVSYGATQIIVESTLFGPFREWVAERSKFFGTLITCMLCGGTWVSAFTSLLIWSPSRVAFQYDVFGVDLESSPFVIFTIIGILQRIVYLWMDAMIGSTIIWFLHLIDNKLSD